MELFKNQDENTQKEDQSTSSDLREFFAFFDREDESISSDIPFSEGNKNGQEVPFLNVANCL